MVRLIDIDVFRSDYKLAEECKNCKRDEKWHCDRQMYSARDICGWLDDAEVVDAAPVVHGRWIKLREASEWDQKRCSVCGEVCCCQGNYCMNCGAKMDGDDNDGRRSDN